MEGIISELIEQLVKAERFGDPVTIEEITVRLNAAHELQDANGAAS